MKNNTPKMSGGRVLNSLHALFAPHKFPTQLKIIIVSPDPKDELSMSKGRGHHELTYSVHSNHNLNSEPFSNFYLQGNLVKL